MTDNRFVNNRLPRPQEVNYKSTFDYEDLPVLTLEEAVDKIIPLLPDVTTHVAAAKKKYNWHSPLLTRDESAAIYLYTMPTQFFSRLNTALRAENQQTSKPWVNFMKLFISALEKLPSTNASIWRGVNYDATAKFSDNEIYTWWDVSSWSMKIDSVQPFLGESGTLFAIETNHGKNISMFSAIPDEQEVILMPGTHVRARSSSLNLMNRYFIIHLEEINTARYVFSKNIECLPRKHSEQNQSYECFTRIQDCLTMFITYIRGSKEFCDHQ